MCVGLLSHHLGKIGTEGVKYFRIGEAELPVAHTAAVNLGEPLRVAVKILLWWNKPLESVNVHIVRPAQRPRDIVVPNVLAVITDTQAAV